jgi:phenylalanyl-tRNA synthetase beta chain
MRVPLSWLNELVDHGLAAEELADRLTEAGIKVEAIHRRGAPDANGNLEHFRVGKVLEAGRHPNADRLSLCRVDIGGDEPQQIVCGAPNVATGQTVAVAMPGALLPGGDTPLGVAKLRGVESHGMILSARELDLGEDHDGIMVLDDALAAGSPLADALPLSETVIELELAANRPDLLGMWGVAREVSVITGAPLCDPDADMPAPTGVGAVDEYIALRVDAPDLCPRYMGTVLTGVRVGPSPDWLRVRLEAAGMRALSNVVDITNYVMLLTGQPLHAFDLDKVDGARIVVRRAQDGEKIVTLDDVERTLDSSMLAICDARRPAVIAGVFGAATAEVDDTTTRVFLEAANFDGPNLLATAWGVGLRTESSRRFEKGLPRELPPVGMAVACRMLVDLCGAKLVPGVLDAYVPAPARTPISLRHARAAAILAMPAPPERSAEILRRLGCDVVEGDAAHEVTAPFWRGGDLQREIDLIEEVGRHTGLDGVVAELPRIVARAERTPMQALRRRLKRLVADLGFSEAMTLHFVPAGDVDKLNLAPDDPRRKFVRLANPLSEDHAVMRRSLLPGLLRAAARNQAHQHPTGAMFETGRTYAPKPDGMADEREWLVALMFGQPARDHWRAPPRTVDFWGAKGVAEALARAAGVRVDVAPAGAPYGHPARQAEIRAGGAKIGWVGEIHPAVLRNFDVKGPAAVVGLDLHALLDAVPAERPAFEDLLSVPASTRDLAVIVADTVTAADVLAAARVAGGALVRGARLFDRYAGDPVPAGKVSLAIRLTIADPGRTLTDEEIEAPVAAVIDALKARFGAELRG